MEDDLGSFDTDKVIRAAGSMRKDLREAFLYRLTEEQLGMVHDRLKSQQPDSDDQHYEDHSLWSIGWPPPPKKSAVDAVIEMFANKEKEEKERISRHMSEIGKRHGPRKAIFQAILYRLSEDNSLSNDEVWESFPESRDEAESIDDDLKYSVFRDGEHICQEYSGGRKPKIQCIGRDRFDDYMADVRDKLRISTRRKSRPESDPE